MNTTVDIEAFNVAWRAQWHGIRPIGHELRTTAADTWVRFHSLPDSKRYAGNDAEYAELLNRHLTLLSDLGDLSATGPSDLHVVTVTWSNDSHETERPTNVAAVLPDSTYWRAVPYDLSCPDCPVWAHLRISTTSLDDDALRSLLLLVADDIARAVIICPPDATWLYHPYDGGGDAIAPDVATRDILRGRYCDWLPTNAKGL